MTAADRLAEKIARALDRAPRSVAAETIDALGRLVDEMPSTVAVEVLRDALDRTTSTVASTSRPTAPAPAPAPPPPTSTPWTPDRPAVGVSRPTPSTPDRR